MIGRHCEPEIARDRMNYTDNLHEYYELEMIKSAKKRHWDVAWGVWHLILAVIYLMKL